MGQEDNSNNNDNMKKEINITKEEKPSCKQNSLRTKVEAMQQKIDELKEKVKSEASMLLNEGISLKSDMSDEQFSDYFNGSKNASEGNTTESGNRSGQSLYFSVSDNSLCSSSTSSTDLAHYNFNEFVNNVLKDHTQKKRLSLLQFHSDKQISLNMMRHSLSEINSKCSEELELIESSLQHLNKLASEFNVNIDNYCEIKRIGSEDINTNHNIRKCKSFVYPKFKIPGVMLDNNTDFTKTKTENNLSTI